MNEMDKQVIKWVNDSFFFIQCVCYELQKINPSAIDTVEIVVVQCMKKIRKKSPLVLGD